MVCQRWCLTKCHTASQVPQVPRLPRKTKVDVTTCHACHAKWMSPSATPATQSGAVPRATERAQARSPVPQVQRLPRKRRCMKCFACHAKRRWMSPSATPATQSGAAPRAIKARPSGHQSQPSAPSATPATQNEGGCHQVPRLPGKRRVPRKTKVDVTKYHACHDGGCRASHAIVARQVQCVPRETKKDGTKCHACHAKRRWMWPSSTPARQSGAAPRATKARPSTPPEPAQCPKCRACRAKPRVFHACQAKWCGTPGDQSVPTRHQRQPSAPSATPATQNEGGCDHVPRHACHTKRRWMSPSATPATQSGAAPWATKRATRASPVPQVPRLRRVPRETKVDVSKCHACLAK